MIQKLRPLVFIRGSGVSALCKMMQQNMFMHLLENSVETLMQQQITAEKIYFHKLFLLSHVPDTSS